METFLTVFSSLNEGFLQTLKLFAITLLGAVPLGLIISFGSVSKFKPLKYITKIFVWIIRGTPLMLQLIIIFYVPGIMNNRIASSFGTDLGIGWAGSEKDRFWAAAVAFIINYACYFSEIYRGGIESIPKGQFEAGQVLGLTKMQIFFKIVLKQVIKRILPAMSNEIITLVKDTSLARIISIKELIHYGYAFLKGSQGISGITWPLFATGVYYLIFSGLLTVLFNKAEKKMSYFS